MKLAVCISGAMGKSKRLRDNLKTNQDIIRNATYPYFEVDYFLATWENTISTALEPNFIYETPEMHYHPVMDTEPFPTYKHKHYKSKVVGDDPVHHSLKKKTLHRTKQILIHNYLIEEIENDGYDMVIRLRYDSILNDKIDWKELIMKSYWSKKAMGFAIRYKRWTDAHRLYDIPHIYNSKEKPKPNDGAEHSQDWNYSINDHMIIHPMSLWSTKRVHELHENKKLQVAEWGWYQVLSQPYGDNHHSYYGGVTLERHYKYTI